MNEFSRIATLAFLAVFLTACGGGAPAVKPVAAQKAPQSAASAPRGNDPSSPDYIIGPGDSLQVFVWGNPDLSVTVPVRPDGRISTPLVEDVKASGKTPSQLAREMERRLAKYIKQPVVTVTVTQFVGRNSEQIRVVGQVNNPQTLPYKERLTLLDVMISVGGLNDFAAGNRATIVREVNGKKVTIPVRLADLMNKGDISANVDMKPGDILIVPESWF